MPLAPDSTGVTVPTARSGMFFRVVAERDPKGGSGFESRPCGTTTRNNIYFYISFLDFSEYRGDCFVRFTPSQ